mmetsp:Transcript_27735/g.50252  ORF Transcript_27735/g.50252 Transcript_27735/m.50252 type:complete len:120 (-) Transcript_27735:649-1008(-)
MNLSRNEFARDTVEFCRALTAVSKKSPKENTAAAPPSLLQWKLVETNIQGLDVVYLTHPPVTREISQTLDDDDDDERPLDDSHHAGKANSILYFLLAHCHSTRGSSSSFLCRLSHSPTS